MKSFAFLLITGFLLMGCTSSRQVDRPVSSGSVRISYEVLRPGDYPWKAAMTVESLVTAAGGLSDFASGIRVVRGGMNVVDRYYGSVQGTQGSNYMGTPLEPGDAVWILRRE
jgi:protein involved in polysaccharide export with SLBB domain